MNENGFGLKFHHFGMATKKPESARSYFEALGYVKGVSIFDPLQSVNLAMFRHSEMPAVELIWAGDNPSPIDNLIKRRDGLIYHLCYTTKDPDLSLAAMKAVGLQVTPVLRSQPAPLFGGIPVSFHYIENVGLVELIEGNLEID